MGKSERTTIGAERHRPALTWERSPHGFVPHTPQADYEFSRAHGQVLAVRRKRTNEWFRGVNRRICGESAQLLPRVQIPEFPDFAATAAGCQQATTWREGNVGNRFLM